MTPTTRPHHRNGAGAVPFETRGVRRLKKHARTGPKRCRNGAGKKLWPQHAAKKVAKRSPKSLNIQLFGFLCSRFSFEPFSQNSEPFMPNMSFRLSKKYLLRPARKWKTIRVDCAGASGSRIGPSREADNNSEKTICQPTHLQDRFHSKKCLKR